MIALPAGTQIWIAAGLTDLRRGFTGLSAIVQVKLEQDPFAGHVFVFRGRRGDLIKVLWWDGDGLCLFAKRLEKGLFIAPWAQPSTGPLAITTTELALLLEGSELVGRTPLSPTSFPLAANGFGFVRRREHIARGE